ncbi:MAG TPA: lamin tail domain-containing protein, partial [Glaciihabitans sp.]|nr:lamin tail domain-containing protein [Glaciihabitans sp.]
MTDPAPPAAGIALNEVHFAMESGIDWIELRNNSLTTSQSAAGLFVASKNDFSDKVALSGTVAPGSVLSIDVSFAENSNGEVKLYLIDSNNQVRDSHLLTRKPGRNSWQEFPADSNEWYNGTSDTRDAQNNPARTTDIVINEIMADPPSKQRDAEFVELHNRGSQPVDVSGWKLKEGVNFTIPPGTIMQPGAYLVIGANASWLNANYAGINAVGNWDGQLANSGEMLKLDDANGNLANAVDYRYGGEWPEHAEGNGSSLELSNPFADNSIGGAWRDSDESSKSSFQTFTINGGVYSDQTRGGVNDDEIRIWGVSDTHIILKDIVLRPTTGSGNLFTSGEVTTLNNNNLDGWQSRGTHARTFHDAAGVHLVADGHGDNKANHMEKAAPAMVAGTAYTLQFQARWVSGKPRLIAQSWDTSWGGTLFVPVPLNLGTPGAANSRLAAAPAPQLTGLRHTPVVPTTTQPVTITARVSATTPLASVVAFHRLDNINANGAWNTTPMTDGGTNGDAVANDGIYSAQITPGSFGGYNASGAVIEFYARATATNGATADLPKSGALQPGLWVVDNQVAPTDLRRMRVVVSAYWLDALNQDSATGGDKAKFKFKYPRFSNQYFPCTFIYNDSEPYYGASVRKTGSPFTRSTGNSLDRARVTLPTDNLLRGKTRVYWDNDGSGGSMLHNRLTRYWLYLFGVPGNLVEVCRVARNNTGFAVRETMEVFDKDMLDRIWENGSDGQFYEMDDKFWMGDDGNTRLAEENGTWDYLTHP